MRWEITTRAKTHIVSAHSSSEAVSKVRQKDSSDIKGARILPQNTVDKIKSWWYSVLK
jgi:hypothetical protein